MEYRAALTGIDAQSAQPVGKLGPQVHMEKAIGSDDALRDEIVEDFLIESTDWTRNS